MNRNCTSLYARKGSGQLEMLMDAKTIHLWNEAEIQTTTKGIEVWQAQKEAAYPEDKEMLVRIRAVADLRLKEITDQQQP